MAAKDASRMSVEHGEASAARRTFAGCTIAVRAELACEQSFVAQDSVEGGAADSKLVCGAKLVPTIEFQHMLHVMPNYSIQQQASRGRRDWRFSARLWTDEQIFSANDAIGSFKKCAFEYACKLSQVSGPTMVQQSS